MPEALRSLRSRDFRAFFGAQTISQIGTYMLSVAERVQILLTQVAARPALRG